MLAKLKSLAPDARNTTFVAWSLFESSDGTWFEPPMVITQPTSRWKLRRKQKPLVHGSSAAQPCHIARLPEDVTLVIFHSLLQACTTDPQFRREQVRINFERMHAPFLLAAVCRSWRFLAVAAPTLWTYIGVTVLVSEPYAYKPPPSSQERIAMEAVCTHLLDMITLLCRRSRDAPLHIVMPIISTPLLFEDIKSFEVATVMMRRAIEILGSQSHRWRTWDICALGVLSNLWLSLHATDLDLIAENGSHQNELTLHLPALEVLTIDHCMLGYGVEHPHTTTADSANLILLAPVLERVQTMVGDGMQVLCSSFMGLTPGNSRVTHRAVTPGSLLTPAVQRLAVRSHTWGQRQFVLPLLRCLAPTLRFLEISLTTHGAPLIPYGIEDDRDDYEVFIDNLVDDAENTRLDRLIQFPNLQELRWIVQDLCPRRMRAWGHFLGIGAGSPNLRIVHLDFGFRPVGLDADVAAFDGCQLTALHISGGLWVDEEVRESIAQRTGATVFMDASSIIG